MLCRKDYEKDYVDDCRSQMKSQLAAYRALIADLKPRPAAAIAAIEAKYV
jgi:hypothetical protein